MSDTGDPSPEGAGVVDVRQGDGDQGQLHQQPQEQLEALGGQAADNVQNQGGQTVKQTGTKPKQKKTKASHTVQGATTIHHDQVVECQRIIHLSSARQVTSSNIDHVIEWFHSNISICGDHQSEIPFSVRCLDKTVIVFNQSLETHGLKRWCIRESDIPILAKMGIVMRASKVVLDFGAPQRTYCS